MKKIKKFLPLAGLVFVAAAFVLSFFATLQIINSGLHAEFKNIIWGVKEVQIETVVITMKEAFGFENSGIAPLPFAGLVISLLGAIVAVIVALFVKKPFAKWIILACAIVILAGGIMLFFAPSAFARNMAIRGCELRGITDKAEIQKQIEENIKDLHEQSPKAAIPVVMGVLGGLGGVATGAGALLPEK